MVTMDVKSPGDSGTVHSPGSSWAGIPKAHAESSKEVPPEIVRLVAKDIGNMGHTHELLTRATSSLR